MASTPTGDFVVAWTEDGTTPAQDRVHAQSFSADGTPLTQALVVSNTTVWHQNGPLVGQAHNGDFVVAWTTHDQDGFENGIAAQRFSRTGELVGPEILIPEHTALSETVGSLVVAPDGDFLLTWSRFTGALGDLTVEAMSVAGNALPGEDYLASNSQIVFQEEDSWLPQTFTVPLRNDFVPEDQETFSVDLFNPTGGAPIFAGTQEIVIFDEDFNPPELQPSLDGAKTRVFFPSGRIDLVEVAMSPQGSTAVLGRRYDDENDFLGLFVAHYDPDGTYLSTRQVHEEAASGQSSGTLVFNNDGELLVAWTSNGSVYGHWYDQQGQSLRRLEIPPPCGDISCAVGAPVLLAPTVDDEVAAIIKFRGEPNRWIALAPEGRLVDKGTFDARLSASSRTAADRQGNFVLVSGNSGHLFNAQQGQVVSRILSPNPEEFSPVDVALADDGVVTIIGTNPSRGIVAARFNQRLQPLGEPIGLRQFEAGRSRLPAIATVGGRHVNAVWEEFLDPVPRDNVPVVTGSGVSMRRINNAWGLLGGEYQVHRSAISENTNPQIDANAAGQTVVAFNNESEVYILRYSPSVCVPSERVLCLLDGRYRLELQWDDGQGQSGDGFAGPLLSRTTGYFWFFGPQNAEVIVEALDGRDVNDKYWIFYGSLSDVEYSMTVTDTMTGETRTYDNPLGTFASHADVDAFAGDDLGLETPISPLPEVLPPVDSGPCVPDSETLCLGGGRFEVTVGYFQFFGPSGPPPTPIPATARPLTNDSGAFWFFGPRNIELIVKVLDGRAINNHFWVFYGALSDVEYFITVRDLVTGQLKRYHNLRGRTASVGDTTAFPAP